MMEECMYEEHEERPAPNPTHNVTQDLDMEGREAKARTEVDLDPQDREEATEPKVDGREPEIRWLPTRFDVVIEAGRGGECH